MDIHASEHEIMLCSTCTTIDFPSYFQPPSPQENMTTNAVADELFKEIVLGIVGDIRLKATTCSFCDLVCASAVECEDTATVTAWSVLCARPASSTDRDIHSIYYLRLRVESDIKPGTYHVQLVAENTCPLDSSSTFLARRPLKRFKMEQARRWLDICLERHTTHCDILGSSSNGETSTPEPEDLIALDLHKMCLCDMPKGSEYLTLSYCWPAKVYLTLIKSNRSKLFEPQALAKEMKNLPGTIRDAIDCSKELPYRYLWIDALCIVQDDPESKFKQLRQMDRVYSAAILTLVSAYPVPLGTSDPCDGFPGYRDSPDSRHRTVRNVQGLDMMLLPPELDVYLQITRWYTRCWTFQEHQLSRRLLYFTPSQVCFQCSCSVFCEDIVCEHIKMDAYLAPWNTLWNKRSKLIKHDVNWGHWSLSRNPIQALSTMWLQFEMAAGYYTFRNISFPSDILNAFEGVKAVLSDAMRTDFWQGMPEKILPSVLTFQLKGKFRRRRIWHVGKPPSEPLFPSWSWAGWDSHIDMNSYVAARDCRSDAAWYIINDEQAATHLNVWPDFVGKQTQRPSRALIGALLPNLITREEIDASSQSWRNAKTLGCWTTHAYFILDGTHHSLGSRNAAHERLWPESTNFAILNEFGETAGCILLPKDHFEAYGVDRMICEFIAISRTLISSSRPYSYFDEKIYETKDWCHLNVMMIIRPSHLGAYEALRAGVGVVHQDAWIEARPETDFVKLV